MSFILKEYKVSFTLKECLLKDYGILSNVYTQFSQND